MMNSKTYISDPKLWEAFYKNMAEKKFSPYEYKPKQIGRGMRKRKSDVIPIRPHSQFETTNLVPQVTPVAAVEERAKSDQNRSSFCQSRERYKKTVTTLLCHSFKKVEDLNTSE